MTADPLRRAIDGIGRALSVPGLDPAAVKALGEVLGAIESLADRRREQEAEAQLDRQLAELGRLWERRKGPNGLDAKAFWAERRALLHKHRQERRAL